MIKNNLFLDKREEMWISGQFGVVKITLGVSLQPPIDTLNRALVSDIESPQPSPSSTENWVTVAR